MAILKKILVHAHCIFDDAGVQTRKKKKLPQEYRLKELIKCAFSSKDAKYLPSFIFFQSKALYPRSKDKIV